MAKTSSNLDQFVANKAAISGDSESQTHLQLDKIFAELKTAVKKCHATLIPDQEPATSELIQVIKWQKQMSYELLNSVEADAQNAQLQASVEIQNLKSQLEVKTDDEALALQNNSRHLQVIVKLELQVEQLQDENRTLKINQEELKTRCASVQARNEILIKKTMELESMKEGCYEVEELRKKLAEEQTRFDSLNKYY